MNCLSACSLPRERNLQRWWQVGGHKRLEEAAGTVARLARKDVGPQPFKRPFHIKIGRGEDATMGGMLCNILGRRGGGCFNVLVGGHSTICKGGGLTPQWGGCHTLGVRGCAITGRSLQAETRSKACVDPQAGQPITYRMQSQLTITVTDVITADGQAGWTHSTCQSGQQAGCPTVSSSTHQTS